MGRAAREEDADKEADSGEEQQHHQQHGEQELAARGQVARSALTTSATASSIHACSALACAAGGVVGAAADAAARLAVAKEERLPRMHVAATRAAVCVHAMARGGGAGRRRGQLVREAEEGAEYAEESEAEDDCAHIVRPDGHMDLLLPLGPSVRVQPGDGAAAVDGVQRYAHEAEHELRGEEEGAGVAEEEAPEAEEPRGAVLVPVLDLVLELARRAAREGVRHLPGPRGNA